MPAGPGEISAAISDGMHEGGNPDFFFLPPLQRSPRRSPDFDRGRFNPNLSPTVKICDGRDVTQAGECGKPLMKDGEPVVFTAVLGWDGLPDWVDPEQYHVVWRTKDYALAVGHPYRILVKVGGTLLGFLDIIPSNRLVGALRVTAGGEDVGWLDDWVVPIRFRIEHGAASFDPLHPDQVIVGTEFTVDETGGSTVLADETGDTALAALSVPAGAVPEGEEVTMILATEEPQHEGECLPGTLVQSGGCYRIRTEPELFQFADLVRVEICVDVQYLTPAQQDLLLVHKYNETQGLQVLEWADPTLIGSACGGSGLGLNETAPNRSSQNVLQRLARWAGHLLAPQDLHAAMPGPVPPKGLGGLAGSFSDFGGAVPATPEPIHYEGTLSVPQTWLVDLEQGWLDDTYFDFFLSDIWFEAETETARYLTPWRSAKLAVFGSTAPGPDGCLALPLSSTRIDMQDLSAGTFVCVLTNEGRFSEVEIIDPPGPSPGTLGIGIRTFEPAGVVITDLQLSSTTLTIGGPLVPYTIELANQTATTFSPWIAVQVYIDQGDASRAAGGAIVTCGVPAGELPPGSCTENWTLNASNGGAGTGTLVPGPATARIMVWNEFLDAAGNSAYTVLATVTAPVILQ